MIAYISFVIVLYILGVLEVCGRKVEKLTLAILIFFIGFRAEIGTDWYAYENLYEGKGNLKVEFFFKKTIEIFRGIGIEFKYYYILISVITILILYYGIKKNISYPTLGLTFFILSTPVGFIFEQIRQFLAISIFIYFFNYGYKIFYFILFILKFIHSSVLAAIFHPILKNKNKFIKKYYLYFLFILIFFRIQIIELLILTLKSSHLLDQSMLFKIDYYYYRMSNIISPGVYIKTIFIILMLLMSKRIIRKYPQKKKEINYYSNLSVVYLILLYITSGLWIAQRIFIYFQIGLNFLIIYLIMSYKDIKLRIFIYSVTISFVSLTFLLSMNTEYFKRVYVPYKNYLYSDLISQRFERIENIKNEMKRMYGL